MKISRALRSRPGHSLRLFATFCVAFRLVSPCRVHADDDASKTIRTSEPCPASAPARAPARHLPPPRDESDPLPGASASTRSAPAAAMAPAPADRGKKEGNWKTLVGWIAGGVGIAGI